MNSRQSDIMAQLQQAQAGLLSQAAQAQANMGAYQQAGQNSQLGQLQRNGGPLERNGGPLDVLRAPSGCSENDHRFVIGNSDCIRCQHCGVACSGENLAALGFMMRATAPKYDQRATVLADTCGTQKAVIDDLYRTIGRQEKELQDLRKQLARRK